MTAEMEFGLLGPLVVRCGGRAVPMPQGKQRGVLAALLLNANRVVTLEELVDLLWGSAPPASARVTVQNYVKRLRQAMGQAGRERISTRPHGYLISAGTEELDVSRFDELLASARAAQRTGSWQSVSELSLAALSLWRGEPLADVGSQALAEREALRLDEMHLQALEARLDADLHLGRHGDVIGELRGLARSLPLREHFHALLMLALYRCGRQGEALAAYADARRVLVGELGMEPGADLRDLHQRILTSDPGLAVTEPAPVYPGAGPVPAVPAVPRELPGAIRHFVGRDEELATLSAVLKPATFQSTMVISAIGGTAGVGKTALALRWAHQVAPHFPDGQLYVNLRGYAPGQPMEAGEALSRFLRTMGVAGCDIPADTQERAARYRSLLAGRQMLILLDNASEVAQVRPLLPGAPGCVTLVTSRDSLAGLVARDGAHRIDLGLLPLPEAVVLLRAMIGARVNDDPASVTELAELCARLPLTLRVAAELAIARPTVPLADLAAELADGRRRLDLMDAGGDASTAVRTVFSWSYRHLDGAAARAFRLAGLHPGPSVDRQALAALAGVTTGEAGRMLAVLARAYLLQAVGPGRYGLHDLLGAYARELAVAHDDEQDRRTALTRLSDYYLGAAAAAMDTAFPAEASRRPRIEAASPVPDPPFPDQAAALAWLDAERANMTATIVYAADHGRPCHDRPGHATRLAEILFRYLDAGGHFAEAIIIHAHAHRAAVRAGDQASEGTALANLGATHSRQGRDQQACEYIRQALRLHGEVGDQIGQVRALSLLGCVDRWRGRYQRAAEHQRQALTLARDIADPTGEAYALAYLGELDLLQDRYDRADEHIRKALILFRELGDRNGEAGALNSLGEALAGAGLTAQSRAKHEAALELADRSGHKYEQARAHDGLARGYQADGDTARAHRHWEGALSLYTDLDTPEASQVRSRLTR
ncbi:MAG TPA: BTAD domain-containing putative transcriptional regulator [Streptosporangiaceae bacterium]|jgi:DNA-binding SARP family transcriptional activator|nr:BTAD domain-containing putative transcriptional regulator [Streptosporangiaceae bacterium]